MNSGEWGASTPPMFSRESARGAERDRETKETDSKPRHTCSKCTSQVDFPEIYRGFRPQEKSVVQKKSHFGEPPQLQDLQVK